MTQLHPMNEADYAAFMAAHFAPYAADRMQADHITQQEADAFVQEQHAQTLPQGLHTPGHRFYNITAEDQTVGSLWINYQPEKSAAFVYDIVIAPQFRRRGHASAALLEAQRLLKSEGCTVLGLNVFAHNPDAQAFYTKLGFAVTSSYMNKVL